MQDSLETDLQQGLVIIRAGIKAKMVVLRDTAMEAETALDHIRFSRAEKLEKF